MPLALAFLALLRRRRGRTGHPRRGGIPGTGPHLLREGAPETRGRSAADGHGLNPTLSAICPERLCSDAAPAAHNRPKPTLATAPAGLRRRGQGFLLDLPPALRFAVGKLLDSLDYRLRPLYAHLVQRTRHQRRQQQLADLLAVAAVLDLHCQGVEDAV
jgi:hypothetical protein